MTKSKPLQSFELPIEIFLIFLKNELEYLCERDIQKIVKAELKIELSHQRIYQILKGLTESGKLISEKKENQGKSPKPVFYYRLNLKLAESLLPKSRISLEVLASYYNNNGESTVPVDNLKVVHENSTEQSKSLEDYVKAIEKIVNKDDRGKE